MNYEGHAISKRLCEECFQNHSSPKKWTFPSTQVHSIYTYNVQIPFQSTFLKLRHSLKTFPPTCIGALVHDLHHFVLLHISLPHCKLGANSPQRKHWTGLSSTGMNGPKKSRCLRPARCTSTVSGPWCKDTETAFQPACACEDSKQISSRATYGRTRTMVGYSATSSE